MCAVRSLQRSEDGAVVVMEHFVSNGEVGVGGVGILDPVLHTMIFTLVYL